MDMEPNRDVKPEEKTESNGRKTILPSKTMLIVRFVVAAYLLWLSYDLSANYFKATPDKTTTMPAWVMILFVVLFSVVGIAVCVITAIALIKGRYRGGKADPNKDNY